MPRQKRLIIQGFTYHCYTRCHNKIAFLNTGFGKKFLIESVRMCQKKYSFELVALENVGDHIHLIIRTLEGEANISRIMQYIKARTAEKYNRATGNIGSFWNERFGCKIIETGKNPRQYFLYLLWYIGYNPYRKGLCSDPRKSDIGFINCYLQKDYEAPVKITLHHFYLELGKNLRQRVKELLKYEKEYLTHFHAGKQYERLLEWM